MKIFRIISCIGLISILSLHVVAQEQDTNRPSDTFYEKVNSKGRTPRQFVNVREADVYIEHRIWRMIDFREKMNQYLYYPIEPIQGRVSFMSMVLEGLKNGSIVAYEATSEDFSKRLTYDELIAQNTKMSQVEVEDFDNPGQFFTRTDTSSFKADNVTMLRIKEDWFIDVQRSVRDCRIIGLCPVIQVYDDEGELKGTQPLFWLNYDGCRNLFANTEAFNRHNSVMRMSYDDVFAWKRFFSSYITKIDNQQDRQISEYKQGIEILMESERIKELLVAMEDDLWVY